LKKKETETNPKKKKKKEKKSKKKEKVADTPQRKQKRRNFSKDSVIIKKKKVQGGMAVKNDRGNEWEREDVPVDTGINKKDIWGDYCNLPLLKNSQGRGKRSSLKIAVCMENKMVYCGPLCEDQCKLLAFKVEVLCNILKDQHSPNFVVSGNVLMYPLCNPSLMVTSQSEVHKIGQTTCLGNQSKFILAKAPVSVLIHCLIRYILDIGDTGLSYLVFQLEGGNYMNSHLENTWGNTRFTCRDKIVRFFESNHPLESSLLVKRCMVLANKTALLKFLNELNMTAVEMSRKRHGVSSEFVNGMMARLNEVRSDLSTFEAKDLLCF